MKSLHYIIHILLAISIILLIIIRPCQTIVQERPTEIFVTDTVYIDTVIMQRIRVPVPIERLIVKIDTVVRDSLIFIDTSRMVANYYQDSIAQEWGVIKWTAVTEGTLLGLDASYRGKYPVRKVTEYSTLTKYKGGLYLTSGIGYNGDVASGDIGLEYITRRGRKYGYEYDFLNGFHSIKTGLRLF